MLKLILTIIVHLYGRNKFSASLRATHYLNPSFVHCNYGSEQFIPTFYKHFPPTLSIKRIKLLPKTALGPPLLTVSLRHRQSSYTSLDSMTSDSRSPQPNTIKYFRTPGQNKNSRLIRREYTGPDSVNSSRSTGKSCTVCMRSKPQTYKPMDC